MNRLHYSEQVLLDVQEIASYLASRPHDAADHVVDAVFDTCDRLLNAPRKGRPRPDLGPDLRSISWKSYMVVYRVLGRDVLVVRLVHTARDISPRDLSP